LGSDQATLRADLAVLAQIEFEGEQRPNYFSFAFSVDDLTVSVVPIMFSGTLPHIRLTEPEASALLGFLGELEIDAEDEGALDALELAVARAASAPDGVRSWVSAGPIPDEEVFTRLLGAARTHRACRITYLDTRGRPYEVTIDPYHLRMERGLWYVIARMTARPHAGQERTFRLDKIASVEVGAPYAPDPIDLSKYADGIFQPSGQPKHVRVVFSEKVAPYAEERWGQGHRVTGGVEIVIEYVDEGWLERTLAVFGGEVLARSAGA
jgi:predicted DNA-binding transcriptional regulator YafY